MAVTSSQHTMPRQHLRGPKQRVHISGWHFKRQSAHVGSFPVVAGYFLTIVSQIFNYSEFLCCYTISFDCSTFCCGFDPVFPLLLCGTLGVWFISTKHLYLENMSYIKQQ